MNTILDLRYGDDIWLSKRSALPKVGGIPSLIVVVVTDSQTAQGGSTSLGKVRLQLFELAQKRGR